MSVSRRQFLTTAALSSLALGLEAQENKSSGQLKMARKPVLICAHNGYNYLDRGYAILSGGGDPLEAGLSVVRGPEDDANDHSVGLGGLPNEEGVVELDSCCMHGPSQRAGSVGGVHDIKNVSLLARAVMEHTGHVMLVGDNATKFGIEIGFARENLLTDASRKMWLLWKEAHSDRDWWGPGPDDPRWHVPEEEAPAPKAQLWPQRLHKLEQLAARLGIAPELRQQAIRNIFYPPTGTIHCSVL
ncbi:MAG TPA: isoaspartyl peptidase/L-asparaginase, partial [Terriglobales bacterium]|nr:isoaspartyl peptidase/L-asparaginase [Terriglobales bacterium]